MQPVHIPFHIPEHTATVAHAAFPKGTVIMRCADLLQGLYQEEAFATLYATLGRPSQDPFRLLLVSLFQFLEGLSDRQTADAVRGRID